MGIYFHKKNLFKWSLFGITQLAEYWQTKPNHNHYVTVQTPIRINYEIKDDVFRVLETYVYYYKAVPTFFRTVMLAIM